METLRHFKRYYVINDVIISKGESYRMDPFHVFLLLLLLLDLCLLIFIVRALIVFFSLRNRKVSGKEGILF